MAGITRLSERKALREEHSKWKSVYLNSLMSKLCKASSYPFSSFNQSALCWQDSGVGKTAAEWEADKEQRSLECRKSKQLLHTHVRTHLFWYTNTWVHWFLEMLPSKALYVWRFTSEKCWMAVNKVNRSIIMGGELMAMESGPWGKHVI